MELIFTIELLAYWHDHISILVNFETVELEEKHDEGSEVVEEANVPDANGLEDQAKELKVAVAFAWVFHPF